MAEVFSIFGLIGLKGADDVNRQLDGTVGKAESSGGKLKAATVAIGTAVGNLIAQGAQKIGQFVGDAMDSSDALQKYSSTMKFAGFKQSDIDRSRNGFKKYADDTVYDLNTITSTGAQLAANGITNFEDLTTSAGNLNAVAGGNADTFKSVAMVLTQTAGAGKLTTENWNQLADAIPGASGMLQKAMKDNGAFTGNFRDAMADGQITAEEFNQALLDLGSQPVAVEAAKSTVTFEGAIGNLEATVTTGLMNIIDAFGKGGMTNAITSFGSGLSGAFDTAVKWIGQAKDTITQFYQKLQETGAIQSLQGAFSAIQIAIGTVKDIIGQLWQSFTGGASSKQIMTDIANAVKGFSDKVTDTVNTVGRFLTQISQSQTAINVLKGAIVGIVAVFGTYKTISTAIKVAEVARNTVMGITFALSQAQAVANGTVTATLAAQNVGFIKTAGSQLAYNAAMIAHKVATVAGTVATGAATAAQWLFNAALNANPIAIVITVIAALVAALVWFFTQTKTGQAIWQGFMNWLRTAWQAISTFFSGLWNGIVNVFNTAVNGIQSVVTSVFSAIQSFFSSVWNGISSFISGVLNNIKNTFQNIWQAISSTISGVINNIAGFISSVWNGITSTISNVMNGIRNTISNVWQTISGTVSSVINGISSTISSVWNGISSTVSNVVNTIKNAVSSGFNGISSTVSTVFNAVKDAIMTPIDTAKRLINDAIETIKGIFNITLSFPKIKLPHFKVDGGEAPWGIGGAGKAPSFGIEWYAKGGILDNPTLFGMNGNTLMGGGEAGREAVIPLNKDVLGDIGAGAIAAAGGGGMGGEIYFTQNNYSPKTLTPREVAKRTKEAAQDLTRLMKG